MIEVILLITIMTYGMLWLMKSVTYGEPPFLVKHKEIVTILFVTMFILLIESFK